MNGHSHAPGANLWLELTRMSAGSTLAAIRQDRKKPLMFGDLISHVRTRSTASDSALTVTFCSAARDEQCGSLNLLVNSSCQVRSRNRAVPSERHLQVGQDVTWSGL